jgi:hypothetical protein
MASSQLWLLALVPGSAAVMDQSRAPTVNGGGQAGGPYAGAGAGERLLEEANRIYQTAAAHGQRLSQRALARQLRGRGHRFPNDQLRGIAAAIGLPPVQRATSNGR